MKVIVFLAIAVAGLLNSTFAQTYTGLFYATDQMGMHTDQYFNLKPNSGANTSNNWNVYHKDGGSILMAHYGATRAFVHVGAERATDLFINGNVGVEGSFNINGSNAGISVAGGNQSFIKMSDGNGNPYLQIVTDQSDRLRSMLVNNWGNNLNPGITIGTTQPDGVAFNVVRNVAIGTDGLPSSNGEVLMTVLANGSVGVGTISPTSKLTVAGDINSREIKVTVNAGNVPDYVFEPTYTLPSLDSVQSYINQNKHLPEVPSAKEMEANGVNLGEMNMLLLKKVEELTLYVIELKQEKERDNKDLLKRINELEKKNR